jgi:hypothetical protein
MHERQLLPMSAPSFRRYLLAAVPVLALALTAVDPAPSQGLAFGPRLVFWLVHVGFGIALLAVLQSALPRAVGRRGRSAWLATAGVGILGALLFAPVAVGVERWLQVPEDRDGSVGERFEAAGPFWQALGEAVELSPAFASFWLALNLPWLLRLDFSPERREVGASDESSAVSGVSPSPGGERLPDAPADALARDAFAEASSEGRPCFFDLVPAALGTELIALSSELHYLRVFTRGGKALILYNLRDAVEELDDSAGMRVHRSHWVAFEHVRRVEKAGQRVHCVMSNDVRIPVSRPNQRAIVERFGLGSEIEPNG